MASDIWRNPSWYQKFHAFPIWFTRSHKSHLFLPWIYSSASKLTIPPQQTNSEQRGLHPKRQNKSTFKGTQPWSNIQNIKFDQEFLTFQWIVQMATPGKINGWKLRIHPWKTNNFTSSKISFSGSLLIFEGVQMVQSLLFKKNCAS